LLALLFLVLNTLQIIMKFFAIIAKQTQTKLIAILVNNKFNL